MKTVLGLTVDCHSLGIYTVILLSLLSLSAEMAVSGWAMRDREVGERCGQRGGLEGAPRAEPGEERLRDQLGPWRCRLPPHQCTPSMYLITTVIANLGAYSFAS